MRRNCRVYGTKPYKVAVIHGGPGGSGEMASVAKELSKNFGVLEPLQTKNSIIGQIAELKETLDQRATLPIVLIGHSWGAWLAFLFAEGYPKYVKKLILVGSPAFCRGSGKKTEKERLSRLSVKEKTRMKMLLDGLQKSKSNKQANQKFLELGQLAAKADAFDPLPQKSDLIKANFKIFKKVWPEADMLRSCGLLVEIGKQIKCPVAAIHGDYDPHPYRGVKEPLSEVIKKFKFILLKKCGHRPWLERFAREEFYWVLRKEISESV